MNLSYVNLEGANPKVVFLNGANLNKAKLNGVGPNQRWPIRNGFLPMST
jgi:uncharacterized protein YjbI with pentapeptide repeats